MKGHMTMTQTWTKDTITVFEVLQNTDMTEGRGREVIYARLMHKADAERIAPGQGVHGSDATIRERKVHVFTSNDGETETYERTSADKVFGSAQEWAEAHRHADKNRRAQEILADSDPLYKQYLELHAKFGGSS